MVRTILAASVLLSLFSLASAQIVNSPAALIECQSAAITFSGGTAPYILSVIPGGQPGAAALETFPTQGAAGAYTWTVDIAAGTEVTIRITDAAGLINYSSPVRIQAGTSSACLGMSNPVGGTTSAGTSAPAGPTTLAGTSAAVTTTRATSVATTTSVSSAISTTASLIVTTSRATTATTASTTAARTTSTTATGSAAPLERSFLILGLGALLALAA